MPSYVSLRPRARIAAIVLGIMVALDACRLVSDLMQQDLLERMAEGKPFTMAEARFNDERVSALNTVYAVAAVVAAVTFLVWFHRAATNHDVFQRVDAGTGRSAVASFFIPILNLVLPYKIMKSVWDGAGYADQHGSSAIVTFWWFTWMGGNLLSSVGGLLTGSAGNDARRLASATRFDMLCIGINALAGVFAILMVRRLSERQEAVSGQGVAETFE